VEPIAARTLGRFKRLVEAAGRPDRAASLEVRDEA